ncbi:hypothetical protein [Rufibacter sp. XAAS-G3-1]|uniref:hypothetical protein n=1 Tax=Rufibacter sp. XAAS-G3-1 TaxID=2729134 RepID=UPI0015E6BD6A|nr:hypothetical protein [Rufibacter sp. XAAS-G3-1]
MIKVKHPLADCNQIQEATIKQLPQEQQHFNELQYSYGNAAYRYHQLAEQHEPTDQDFKEWLDGLPENIRKDMEAKGFESYRNVLGFSRYVNEKNDLGMEEYVRELMGQEEYTAYKNMLEPKATNAYPKEEDSNSEFDSPNSDNAEYKT